MISVPTLWIVPPVHFLKSYLCPSQGIFLRALYDLVSSFDVPPFAPLIAPQTPGSPFNKEASGRIHFLLFFPNLFRGLFSSRPFIYFRAPSRWSLAAFFLRKGFFPQNYPPPNQQSSFLLFFPEPARLLYRRDFFSPPGMFSGFFPAVS